MHVGEGELGRVVAPVDGLHRRALLRRALAGGCALGLGPVAASSAAAAATPTAARAPDAGPDGELAAFEESVELALVAAYRMAIGTGALSRVVGDVAREFADHHQAHAIGFARVSRGAAGGRANAALLAALDPQLPAGATGDQVVRFLLELEEAAAATHLAAVGGFGSVDALRLTASILPVESQHATVWGIVVGRSGAALFPDDGQALETVTAAFDPARYPTS